MSSLLPTTMICSQTHENYSTQRRKWSATGGRVSNTHLSVGFDSRPWCAPGGLPTPLLPCAGPAASEDAEPAQQQRQHPLLPWGPSRPQTSGTSTGCHHGPGGLEPDRSGSACPGFCPHRSPSLCLPEAPPPGCGGHPTNLCRPARLVPPGKTDAPRAQEASEPSSPSEARLPHLMSGPLAEPLLVNIWSPFPKARDQTQTIKRLLEQKKKKKIYSPLHKFCYMILEY